MAKHWIGFGLFVSIVGFFVTAFWFFSSGSVSEVVVAESPGSVSSWNYCDRKRRPKNLDSPRAMADRGNGTITIYMNELEIQGESPVNPNDLSASFTFFAVRGDEVRVVDVIHDSLVRSVRRDAGPKWIVQYEASWVKDLSWDDNLYVMADIREGSNQRVWTVEFSKDSAVPVLIRN